MNTCTLAGRVCRHEGYQVGSHCGLRDWPKDQHGRAVGVGLNELLAVIARRRMKNEVNHARDNRLRTAGNASFHRWIQSDDLAVLGIHYFMQHMVFHTTTL